MSRKKRDYSRQVLPDPKYKDVVVTKVINGLTRDGKKSVAESAFYRALDSIQKKTNGNPLEIFHQALGNVRPVVEVRSARAQALAIRWLVNAANSRSERRIEDRLANELLDAMNNRGVAVKKKEDTHRMAEANKAFAHFRW
jgi:small subunit ribosomal protein S7